MNTSETIQSNENLDAYSPDAEQEEQLKNFLTLCRECEAQGIGYAIAGGYGLDGLYGKLTRAHDDIDMVVDDKDVERLSDLLLSAGCTKNKSSNDKFVFERKEGGKTSVKIELAGASSLAKEIGVPLESIIPQSPNASLLGQKFKALDLNIVEMVIRLQNERAKSGGWFDYPTSKRENQESILAALKS